MTSIKNLIIGLFAAVVVFASCKSNKTVAESVQQESPQKQELENALLWKIEGKGLTTPSYLYGTIHIIDADEYYLPEGTLSAMGATNNMVFEIDMNDMQDMSKMMGLMMKAFMKDGKKLSDLISEEDYKVVNDHFSDMGLPLAMLERIKPMFLSAFAYGDIDPTSIQTGAMKSYEMEFMKIAEQSGKPVAGLETIEFQMGIFDSIPYADQAKMLVETIKLQDTENDEFDKMIAMYKAQDITGMINMISEEDQGMAEHEDVLVTQRNKNWIPIMADMMKANPTFFAVGAGHLAGYNGVIRLLQREGYKVTPISHQKG